MAVIGDLIGEVGDLGRERAGLRIEAFAFAGVVVRGVMFDEALAGFPCEIEAVDGGIFLLQFLNDAEALAIVLEAAVIAHEPVQDGLARMAEGRMAQVVRQGDGLGQVLVQAQRAGDHPRQGNGLQGVRQAGAVVVPLVVDEYLGLVLQASEGAGVDNPVPVALEGRPERVLFLGVFSPPGFTRAGGVRG